MPFHLRRWAWPQETQTNISDGLLYLRGGSRHKDSVRAPSLADPERLPCSGGCCRLAHSAIAAVSPYRARA